MRTIVILGLLLVAAGGAFYYLVNHGGDYRRACNKVSQLCSNSVSVERCERDFSELEKKVGREMTHKAARCVEQVDSCLAMVPCAAGLGSAVASKFLGGVLSSVGQVVSEKARGLLDRVKRAVGIEGSKSAAQTPARQDAQVDR
ncbi:MAG: hypothetical protein H6707_00780 [Deltaproteobacteria bacterium]|nr:hypothetical protein [Deltaproteobacteria bacterium]